MTGGMTGSPDNPQQIEGASSWQILLVGALLYFTGLAIYSETNNEILVPLVGLLGSFTVPVSYIAYFWERRGSSKVSLNTVVYCFFYGGILGAFAAGLLEPVFIRGFGPIGAFQIGLIEEFAKIVGVLLIARHMRHTSMLTGLILGAAAGMGFAGFESNGYSFQAFLRTGGNLPAIAEVTVLRGLMAPFAHGTWTAILSAVLFRQSAPKRFRFDVSVLTAFLGVALLHGLWDSLPLIMSALGFKQAPVFGVQLLIGLIGLLILAMLWRDAKWLEVSETRHEEQQ
jgi:RsiW-degrading membrane proteinase PrsW (M82 family)